MACRDTMTSVTHRDIAGTRTRHTASVSVPPLATLRCAKGAVTLARLAVGTLAVAILTALLHVTLDLLGVARDADGLCALALPCLVCKMDKRGFGFSFGHLRGPCQYRQRRGEGEMHDNERRQGWNSSSRLSFRDISCSGTYYSTMGYPSVG